MHCFLFKLKKSLYQCVSSVSRYYSYAKRCITHPDNMNPDTIHLGLGFEDTIRMTRL